MRTQIRQTRSLCPLCLKNLPARLTRDEEGRVYIERSCPEHGAFSGLIWQGCLDFDSWTRGAEPLDSRGADCPGSCGICPEHEIGTCCALLEVTNRCNLRCRFCFANGGESSDEPSIRELKAAIDQIALECGGPLLQLSGGEPTLRDDLPELVAYAKKAGCRYVQLNTNGIRLAEDRDYLSRLAEAGLDIVFLQFDGMSNSIYEALRGKPLLELKLEAIKNCSEAKLGVTLVPTVVQGVNDTDLGNIIRFAAQSVSTVKGVHFQPVSYFGRHPEMPAAEERYTLDRLMADICRQTGLSLESFMPSRCDHPLCGFHGSYIVDPKLQSGDRENISDYLQPVTSFKASCPGRGSERDNREYVARHWICAPDEAPPASFSNGDIDFDSFLYCMRHSSLSLSAMAFQDAGNINIERLHRCSLHVYDRGVIKPFCAKYLTPGII